MRKRYPALARLPQLNLFVALPCLPVPNRKRYRGCVSTLPLDDPSGFVMACGHLHRTATAAVRCSKQMSSDFNFLAKVVKEEGEEVWNRH